MQKTHSIERTAGVLVSSPVVLLGSDKRTPFGWPVFPVTSGEQQEPVLLRWDATQSVSHGAWLKLTIALEVWEDAEIEIRLAGSKRVIGCITLHYCDVFEIIELALSCSMASDVEREGIELHLTQGAGPVWLFGGETTAGTPLIFTPHLMRAAAEVDRKEQFLLQFNSLASLQQFSWKEGCVLDGLFELASRQPDAGYRETIERHLNQFMDENNRLRYEDPWGTIVDDRIYGIEGTLPFAVIARIWPDHPSLAQMTDYYATIMQEDGAMYDEGMLSAEGNYTIAYPLVAVAGLNTNAKQLEDSAIHQLYLRRGALTEGEDLYLRRYYSGERTFRNWIRAYTWYMLGLARTLRLLQHRDDINDLREEFVRVANIILSHQQPDGLWRVFVDDPSVGVETSGSAGIAAALTIGVQIGLLPEAVLTRTRLTLQTLVRYLTADGLLSGVSQANKNGEALQRSDYRIHSQMGMGLMAQLWAALGAE